MNSAVYTADDISNICFTTGVEDSHSVLLQKLARIYPELSFVHVLTRSGWHRVGGVINNKGKRVTKNLREWLEKESAGDINKLIRQYADSEYIATSLIGKTHYFVAQTGEDAHQFVQLEIEEIQEVQDHQLLDIESLPDDIEDIIDPIDAEKLEPVPVGAPFYLFRRIRSIAEFMQSHADKRIENGKDLSDLQRFMQDWDRSSAKEAGPFSHFWVLSLREYTDAWGEPVTQGKPVSTIVRELPLMELNSTHRGAKLAGLIHQFDHTVGYPMAWYFYMLSHREVPFQLAEAIHKDLMGAYDYLPVRDLKVLKDWSAKPYGI